MSKLRSTILWFAWRTIVVCVLLTAAGSVYAKEQSATPQRLPGSQTTSTASHSPVQSETSIRDKWALIVGISNFKNPSYNLKFAAKDAIDFRNFLVNEANFAPDHVKLLIDQQATEKAIKSAFGDKFLPRVSMPGDLVVIFVSTHGTPSSTDQAGEYYLMAWDSDIDDLYATGVNMKDLADRIKRAVKTDRALIVMDTCYSGGATGGGKGLARVANVDAAQLAIGKGHRVISSSGNNERSYESSRYPNGVFTHYLIEALRQDRGKVDIQKAFDYMKSKVQWEVQSDRGASQNPKIAGDWSGQELMLTVPPAEKRSLSPDLAANIADHQVQPATQTVDASRSNVPLTTVSPGSAPNAVSYLPPQTHAQPQAQISSPTSQPQTGYQYPTQQGSFPPANQLMDNRLVGIWEGTLVNLVDHWNIVLQVAGDGSYQSVAVGTKGTQATERGFSQMFNGRWMCRSEDGQIQGGTYVVSGKDEFILVGTQGPIVYRRRR